MGHLETRTVKCKKNILRISNKMSSFNKITLLPQDRQLQVESGMTLMEALVDHSIFLRSDCGGVGNCGKCNVSIVAQDGSAEVVPSCSLEITEDLRIEIPESSMLSPHIIGKAPVTLPPSFKKRTLPPSQNSQFGIAADLGTTTIAIYLCNTTGEIVSSIAVKNPQALYGDDVMSRIGAIDQEENNNLSHLQNLVVKAIEWGTRELLTDQNLNVEDLVKIVAVGNPTMIHILAGVDPEPIGVYPYQPAFYEATTFSAADAGFELGDISIQTFPQVSGFIGGDILSAALAVDLENQPEGTLLIDLGTNGELLMKGKDQFFATSCATGPAFEGASLSCGMQAIPGAVNKVTIDSYESFPDYTIINPKNSSKTKPSGICGTGVISGVAELYRKQILEPSGAFKSDKSINPLKQDSEGSTYYTLVQKDSTQNGEPVFISQRDIRAVQLGKAALITGIEFLSRAAGFEQPQKIIIAGAFGTYIDKEDMFTLGMIPPIDADAVEVAGNSAGGGAVMALVDEMYLKNAIEMAGRITTIDLASDISFQEIFIQKLSFPS
jgi:uncharacterized 2Fe-2S/4Fe-4S cluster protein (DUF4445 family)